MNNSKATASEFLVVLPEREGDDIPIFKKLILSGFVLMLMTLTRLQGITREIQRDVSLSTNMLSGAGG